MNRFVLSLSATLGLMACGQASAATIAVLKDPNCGCCTEWVEHLRREGFTVAVTDVPDQPQRSAALGVPEELRSCHTATIDGYVIEGHVPASDIRRLVAERPSALGIAVPGMPMGSPGMEQGGMKQAYVTVLFDKDSGRVFARH